MAHFTVLVVTAFTTCLTAACAVTDAQPKNVMPARVRGK